MVMDFIEGETLQEDLETIAPRLPLEEVLAIGSQLCSALGYLRAYDGTVKIWNAR